MVNQDVGFDMAQLTQGRKQFTWVDTFGLLIAIKVVAASVPEREGAKPLLTQVHQERQRVPRLARIWVDGGFVGEDFRHWVMAVCRWVIEVSLRPAEVKGLIRLPKRWLVERTSGWLHWGRRLNVDYERLPASSSALSRLR